MMMMAHTSINYVSRYCEITSKFFFLNVSLFFFPYVRKILNKKKKIRRNFFYSLFVKKRRRILNL